jgi:uncharacterized delta-60 repeat protein
LTLPQDLWYILKNSPNTFRGKTVRGNTALIEKPFKTYTLKKIFLIFILYLIVVSLGSCSGGGGGDSSPTPSIITWAKTYGGVNDDIAHSIQQTSDGGFIVAGETSSSGAGFVDFWISKLNANGEVVWQKTYGGINDDIAYSIQQTSDGFIVAGMSSSFGNLFGDIWVLKLNANGDVDWQKTYGGSGSNSARCIQQISDGFIVAGETSSSGAGNADFWILKLNSSGNPVWQKTYGGSGVDKIHSIQHTSDGFIVAGETDSFGAGNADFWVLKLDSSGNVLWQKTYGESGYDIANFIQQTSDGGFIVAGETSSFGAGNADFWVLKLDSSGNVLWQKTYGGVNNDITPSIQETLDGGFIVAGETSSFGAGNADFWVLKLDSAGVIQWEKTYGGSLSSSANLIRQASDEGYILAGETSSLGAGSADVWILKLDGNGNIGSGCSVIGTSSVTVSSTGITAVDSSGTVNNTNATVTQPSVIPQDSTALIATQCSSP